jgi:hypothetical protein
MRARLRVNDASIDPDPPGDPPPGGLAERVAMLVVSLVACSGAGCGSCRERPRVDDAHTASLDGVAPQDGIVDSEPVVHDGGELHDADANAGSADHPITDGGTAAAMCPAWPQPPATGRGWLYVRTLTSGGVVLTPDANHVDIYVRRTGDPLPGERADPNDPCAVASYEQSTQKVLILAAAIGFSSQERVFVPQQCRQTSPCSIDLPQRLASKYYQVRANSMSLRVASDVPQAERAQFAADVASDALARSKALGKPIADELDRAAKATDVPAVDLAIRYSENKLGKRCDARCLDEPKLDLAIRTYLKNVRRPRANPFELRTPPERWRKRTR